MRQAASRAVSAFRGALDMHSPSRVLVGDGMLMAESVGIGVERNTARAARSMVRLAREMAGAWPRDMETGGWNAGGGEAAHGGADPSGAQGGIVINNNGPITIREEADIERVAAELYGLIREEKRGG